ncbi:5,6-dimethylbenzimidazole synthase [Roseovarius dicentrarchi]|uniref:5,6-dimethylbenzimidazole synthase n=1 Tax=Roseovarius dicentrarchi TaxID=2250573 RepID=UPI000DE8233B|nr:5,6-dimethylbenzimidazole synthase [Roseovarius dicentrarchi]
MSAFSTGFQSELADLMRWRRDVRHFRTDPIDEAALLRCLDSFNLAPSVGLSEPWRLMRVDSAPARAAAVANFEAANSAALAGYNGDRAALYAGLKLSGMMDAPVHLAVWCDDATPKGAGLGAATMPEMRRYSVVGAITQFWLAARAAGLGVGWVSILDPAQLARDLDAPPAWQLIAYLCVGWPLEDSQTPELETAGWEARAPALPVLRR